MLGGCTISWYSRTQKLAASAISESEYVALAGIVQEVLFLGQLQTFIIPALERYPIIMMEDNQGPINMANNKLSGKRTRHIDVKHHVVRNATDAGRVCRVYMKAKKPACRSTHQALGEEFV